MHTSEQKAYEELYSDLLNSEVKSVKYYEIAYEPSNPTPYFQTKFERIHSVDFSVVLITSNGKFEICWDDEFFQFGIGINTESKSIFSNYQSWDVTAENLWTGLIGHQIISVDIDWEKITIQYSDGTEEFKTYPQSIRIKFSNNKTIFISAAGFLNEGDDEVMGMSDNLTITDNEELARHVKMIV